MAKSRAAETAGVLACLLVLLPFTAAHGQSLDSAVLNELNFARTQPQAYARVLEDESQRSRASGAYDDPAAFREAVAFLERQQPLPPLSADDALAEAALDHAALQARDGGFGHGGDEPLSQRLRRYGAFASLMAEDIAYGYADPREVVSQLIVDSGVPGRGHRANIFNPTFRTLGVACGPHPTYGVMCVTDFASRLMRR